MNIEFLLSRLQKVKQIGHGNWIACCPAHEDHNPSLAIRECEDGRILIHCFAECSVSEVLDAMDLDFNALFPEKKYGGPHAKPLRKPWNPTLVLTAVAYEVLLTLHYAKLLQSGTPLTKEDYARLLLCTRRLQAAVEVIHG